MTVLTGIHCNFTYPITQWRRGPSGEGVDTLPAGGYVPGEVNRTKPKHESIELNRTQSVGLMFDWYGNRTQSNWNFSVSSITELNRSNRTQSTRLVRFCLAERQTHPVSIESARSISSMYLKQFENENNSINAELTIIFFFQWFKIDKFTINTGKRASTGTSSRCKCPSWPWPSSVTFQSWISSFLLIIINFSPTLTAKAGTRGSL